ncbi:MAG: D-alanyl-D-alanine carboxypeptidase family protein [Paracoccaceae bacterium]
MRLRLVILILTTLVFLPAQVLALETTARAAVVMDFRTGTVLLEKNPDQSLPPASMSKLMTINMVFEALADGRLSLDEELPVSKHATSYKGSTMFLTTRDKVRVEDLIRGVIVLSGNDASVVLAEALAGSETEFARAMNERAKQLGMTHSTFANANGWPHPNQRMSARDLVTLAARIIREFPQYYGYFGEKEFKFDGRAPANSRNRNPLLKLDVGADGLKTGHTSEAGYGVVGSGVKNGRRVVLMISGLDSEEARAREAEKLMNWAFRQFIEKKILSKGDVFAQADIWLGEQRSVDLVAHEDLTLLLPASVNGGLKAEVRLQAPILAPVTEGQALGEMTISVPGMSDVSLALVAAASVEKAGLMSRLRLSASLLGQKILDLVN